MVRGIKIPKNLRDREDFYIKVVEIAAEYYAQNDSAHDFDHATRVTVLALHVGQEENADLDLLFLAGVLHDTARHAQELTGVCHASRGAEIAGEILRPLGYDFERTMAIQEMIRTHRFRKDAVPKTLEAKILYDADKLDAIGAIGIGRAYAVSGLHGQKLYTPEEEYDGDDDSKNYSPVFEYRFKLKKIIDKMLTPTGKKMAEHRHTFMKAFFKELAAEVNGEV